MCSDDYSTNGDDGIMSPRQKKRKKEKEKEEVMRFMSWNEKATTEKWKCVRTVDFLNLTILTDC